MDEDNISPQDREFLIPEENYSILLGEMMTRIKRLQMDMLDIRDDELRGEAQKIYTDLKIKYFDLLKSELILSKVYRDDDTDEVDLDGVL